MNLNYVFWGNSYKAKFLFVELATQMVSFRIFNADNMCWNLFGPLHNEIYVIGILLCNIRHFYFFTKKSFLFIK